MRPTHKNSHKVFLRNKLRSKVTAISKAGRRRKSALIQRELAASDFVREARKILIYVGRADEVDTLPLIRELLTGKQAVYLPTMCKNRIQLYRVKDLGRDLHLGSFGILEPKRLKSRAGRICDMDVVIVPGLGFTREGARLGRGAGYFDRLLAKADRVIKIGICYREQLLKSIPTMAHDVRMNFVVTD